MFEAKQGDYVPLGGHAFGWRWTEKDRVDIAPDALRRIKPLTPQKAEEAMAYSEAFQGEAYRMRFREIDQYDVDGRWEPALDDKVRSWLHGALPREQERIFVSWTERMAVETDRDTFVQHWDTFCYPVEDVVIWPQSERWVLLFDYKQRFYFAVADEQGAV